MMLSLCNISNESIKVFFCNKNKLYVVRPFEKIDFLANDELIKFKVFSNHHSDYLKKNVFQVSTTYTLNNVNKDAIIKLKKREIEDYSFNKYIAYVSEDETIFSKIEHSILDRENIKKQEKKGIMQSYVLLFISTFFSKVNIIFAFMGVVISEYLGLVQGVLCFLGLFTMYFFIIFIINWFDEKDISVDNLITNEYIEQLFWR